MTYTEGIKKICFAASSGGHLEQLLRLESLMEKYDSFIVTEKTPYEENIAGVRTYYLKKTNSNDILYILFLFFNAIKSICIFLRERPGAVISTGVAATVPICLLAKLFRKKVIYIESFAKTTSPTRTGRLLYKFADRFYVQWPSMLKVYPNATYLGGIY